MDTDAEWEGSTLFSPSKARAQQAQAKDWASVESWLSKKYASKRLPPFERNEETLQALLTLAALNENADEQRNHVERVEKAALMAHTKRASNTDKIYQYTLSKFDQDQNQHLDILAETVVCLNSPDTDVKTLATALVDLTSQKFVAERQMQTTEFQLNALKSEQEKVTKLLQELKHDRFQPPSDLAEQTAEWARNSKHLKAKVAEYDDRLSTIRSSQPSTSTLESVMQYTEGLRVQTKRLSELDSELKAFQSLPSTSKAAQAKVDGARDELLKLTQERDRLFERLAEGT